MADIHHLIRSHGRETARRMIDEEQIPFFSNAATMLAEENDTIGITYSGFCLTSLPHRRLPDNQPWVRSNGGMSLLIEPGRAPTTSIPRSAADYRTIGVPYGAKARLILLYLQTEAIRNNSPIVQLGRSMNAWLGNMGVAVGGKTYKEVRNQAERINRCKLTFDYTRDTTGGTAVGFRNDSIVRDGIRLKLDDQQGDLWDDKVRLSDTFFNLLKEHPVPVSEVAIRLISSKSMALDVYIWLAYRLHVLQKETRVSWASIYEQFGPVGTTGSPTAQRARFRAFKQEFRLAIEYALSVYEDAQVKETQEGFLLKPSKPPIPAGMIGQRALL